MSRQSSLLNREGSRVSYGDLILVPVNETILYIRPLYLSSEGQTPIPELKQVIVVWGSEVVMKPTLREALETMFPGADVSTFEEEGERAEAPTDENEPPPDSSSTTTTSPTTVPPDGEPTQDPTQLLADASRLFSEARTAAAAGDIATFGSKLQEAIDKVEQAERILSASTTTSTTEPETDA